MTDQKITIAIDGYSSCGKSTLAKALAHELKYIFIDSGAMYRGITLFAFQSGSITENEVNKDKLIEQLDSIELRFELNQQQVPELFLNGKNVAQEIRTPEVSGMVSKVAAIPEVREKLVSEQRNIGRNGGIVMDGRDIGSVVFPNAELKLFITAQVEIRVDRRYAELKNNGIEISRDKVRENLVERDHLDSTRDVSPLVQTPDAIVIDNSELTREEQLQKSLNLVKSLTTKA